MPEQSHQIVQQPQGQLSTHLGQIQATLQSHEPRQSVGVMTSRTTRGVFREAEVGADNAGSAPTVDNVPRWG